MPQAPTDLDLQAASDTGISTIDNITSDTTPSLTLTCETNSIVKLYKNDQAYNANQVLVQAACAAASGGVITLTSPSALTDGTYSFVTTQTDVAGNKSPTSTPLSITIDTVAPVAPADPTLDTTSGRNFDYSSTMKIVIGTFPSVKVTCTPGEKITLYNGSSVLAS
jgi:hypothetical protein